MHELPVDIDRLLAVASSGKVTVGEHDFFLKTAGDRAMLHAEAEGLALLAETDAVRVPQCYGIHRDGNDQDVLILEWLELRTLSNDAAAALGRGLAQQHRVTARHHGLENDNFIGMGRQHNAPSADWPTFFRDCRLMPLLKDLAGEHWYKAGLELADSLDGILGSHQPEPSLLHGDLWGGNAAMLPNETPVIFDPAVHFGDRECDLAMTKLFGGFPPAFYHAYEEAWPLPQGAAGREPLYQLYHVLNHARLFGGGYVAQAGRLIQQLLRR